LVLVKAALPAANSQECAEAAALVAAPAAVAQAAVAADAALPAAAGPLAAAALPASSSLQVCISSRGVLKVTHMLTLAGSAAMAPEPQPLMGTFTSQVRRAVGWVGPASW